MKYYTKKEDMVNYFEPVLSEEQMAAYLDGMLSADESNMIEELIDSNIQMTEIQDVIDSVDTTYLYETNNEIPIECLVDDFSLPDIDYGESHTADITTDEFAVTDSDNEDYGYQENSDDMEFQEDYSETVYEDSFLEDDISI